MIILPISIRMVFTVVKHFGQAVYISKFIVFA